MAINKALGVGVNSVLHWFENNADTPYFSVWDKKTMLFQNSADDMEVALQKLSDNISAAEQNGYNDVLVLKLHPKKEKSGYVTDKSETIASFTFRPAELPQYQPYQQYAQNNSNSNAILEKLTGIESRLNAIEEEEEIEEEVEQPKGIAGYVETLLQNEQIQSAMAGLVTNFLGKILAPKMSNQMALAGIPEEQDEKILLAINILKQHDEFLGDDLIKLSEMAVSNNGQFNFLLSMLRK